MGTGTSRARVECARQGMKDGKRREPVDGRYEVSGLVGGAGMGEVYLARDRVLGRDVG